MSLKVKVVAASGAHAPKQATKGSSGFDLVANLKTPLENDPHSFETYDMVLNPGDRKIIPTGLKVAIPFGFEGQIRSRSGLAKKNKVTVLNSPGTIDSDYRGEVGVLLINNGNTDFIISDGERIAQIVFQKIEQVEWEQVDSLEDSDRGEGGFGSTGTKTTNDYIESASNNPNFGKTLEDTDANCAASNPEDYSKSSESESTDREDTQAKSSQSEGQEMPDA